MKPNLYFNPRFLILTLNFIKFILNFTPQKKTVLSAIQELPHLSTLVDYVTAHEESFQSSIEAIYRSSMNIIVCINNNATQVNNFLKAGWSANLFSRGRAIIIISSESYLIESAPVGTIIIDIHWGHTANLKSFNEYLAIQLGANNNGTDWAEEEDNDDPNAIETRNRRYDSEDEDTIDWNERHGEAQDEETNLKNFKSLLPRHRRDARLSPDDPRYFISELKSGKEYLKAGSLTLYNSVKMIGQALNAASFAPVTSGATTPEERDARRFALGETLKQITCEYCWGGEPLKYDPVTGNRIGGHSWVLMAGEDGRFVKIMEYDTSQGTLVATYDPNVPLLWPGNTTRKPDSEIDSVPVAVIMGASYMASTNVTVRQVASYAIAYVNDPSLNLMPPKTAMRLLQFSTTIAPELIVNSVPLKDYGVAGVVGSHSSSASTLVQNVVSNFKIPQISPSATSLLLSNKIEHPTFMRVVPPDSYQGRALIALAVKFKWTEVSVLVGTDSYSQGLASTFFAEANAKNIRIVMQTSPDPLTTDMSEQIKTLRDAGTRVLYILHFSPGVVAAAMYKEGWNPLAVVLPDAFASQNLQREAQIRGFPLPFVRGWLCLIPRGGNGDYFDKFLAYVDTHPLVGPNVENFKKSLYSGYFFMVSLIDAILTFADGIKRTVMAGKNPRNGTELLASLYETNTNGLTGDIRFDKNGDRIGPYDVWSVVGGEQIRVGRIHPDQRIEQFAPIVWPSGTTEIPTSPLPRDLQWIRWDHWVGILFGTLAACGLLMCAIVGLVIFTQRHTKPVNSSGWTFLCATLVGAVLGFGSVFPWIGYPRTWICGLRIWMTPMAFVLILAPLVIKTWRLHHVWRQTNILKKILPVPTWRLFLATFALVLVQIIICVFWISFASLKPVVTKSPRDKKYAFALCPSNQASKICMYVTIAYLGFVQLVTAFVAFRVRKLPKNYNESRWVGFSIYNSLIVSIAVLIIGFVLQGYFLIVIIFVCVASLLIPTGMIILLFGPKLWAMLPCKSKSAASIDNERRNGERKAKARIAKYDTYSEDGDTSFSAVLHTPGNSAPPVRNSSIVSAHYESESDSMEMEKPKKKGKESAFSSTKSSSKSSFQK